MTSSSTSTDGPIHEARAAYVVVSHGDWGPVTRLASAICSSSRTGRVLVVHDDRRASDTRPAASERVHYVAHGLPTDWGSWELVDASLLGLREARDRIDPDMVVLLSGTDYPLRPLDGWENEVRSAPGWVGTARPLAYHARWGIALGDGDDRLTRYTYRWQQTPLARLLARRGMVRLAGWERVKRIRHGLLRRTEPVLSERMVARGRGRYYGIRRWPPVFTDGRPCYYGSQWFAARRSELDRLLDVDLARGSRLHSVYRRSIIPDESAFVTPLSWHSPPGPLAPVSCIIPEVGKPEDARILTLADLDELLASGSAFGRKVDPVLSAPLLDVLDRIAQGQPR